MFCLYVVLKKMDWYFVSYKCNQLYGYLVDWDVIFYCNLNFLNVYYWIGLIRMWQIWIDGELMQIRFGLLSNYVVDYICGWQSINLFFLIWCIDKVLVD